MENATKSNENINTWISQINNDFKAAVSVDCVIFGYTDADLYVAVLKCNMPPYEGMSSLIGDILKPSETLDSAAFRILEDRTGLKDIYLEQVQSFGNPGRHPFGRVITVAYYSLLKLDEYTHKAHKSGTNINWVKISDLTEMAFDHKAILDTCFIRLQNQIKDRPIGFNLLPKKFTLKQLQQLYEVILGITLDKRNFRRKLTALNILKDQNEFQKEVSHRPAKLFSFNDALYVQRNGIGFLF